MLFLYTESYSYCESRHLIVGKNWLCFDFSFYFGDSGTIWFNFVFVYGGNVKFLSCVVPSAVCEIYSAFLILDAC